MGFSAENYDAVNKLVKNSDGSMTVKKFYHNLRNKAPTDALVAALERYDVTDQGENNKYRLHDPTYKEVCEVRKEISKRLKEQPDKIFFVIYVAIGHGIMQYDGIQAV